MIRFVFIFENANVVMPMVLVGSDSGVQPSFEVEASTLDGAIEKLAAYDPFDCDITVQDIKDDLDEGNITLVIPTMIKKV